MSDVMDIIKEIAAEQFDVEESEITPDTSFDDMNADSLDMVELMMAIEEEFGIEIPDEDAEGIKTVRDAAAYIENMQ